MTGRWTRDSFLLSFYIFLLNILKWLPFETYATVLLNLLEFEAVWRKPEEENGKYKRFTSWDLCPICTEAHHPPLQYHMICQM